MRMGGAWHLSCSTVCNRAGASLPLGLGVRLNPGMTPSGGRWFYFDHFRGNGWKDEQIRSCYLGKVFYIWSHRNAWWGTESNRYPADAFFPTLMSAKAAVEEMRTQGTQWRIDEIPALVVGAETNFLAVTEINANEPLADFARTNVEMRTLEQVGEALRPLRQFSVIRLTSEPKLAPPAQLPFRIHHPRSQGGKDVPFWWSSAISRVELGSVLALITTVSDQLQNAGKSVGATA
jgi:hypothetical protein